MSGSFDRTAIAARIRGIVAGHDDADARVIAERLGVDESGFRMSVDFLAPNPTIDVITAVISTHGIDPGWLLTGDYDPAAHRCILEGESVEAVVSRFMTPPGA